MNVRPETIKLLEENIDSGLSEDCLDLIPKSKVTKAKINKWNYSKLKTFCTAKQTINSMKKQPKEWEKIYVNHLSNKGLITKIYKELYTSIGKKPNNPIKK